MSNLYKKLSPTQRKSLDFLQNELRDGAKVSVIELQQKARAARIPLRSLTASRKLLQIEVSRDGQCGAFLWELPKEKA